SSSSRETASARISRSVKSLKFRAMPPSVLILDSVSRLWFRYCPRQLLPPPSLHTLPDCAAPRHLAASCGSQPPQNAHNVFRVLPRANGIDHALTLPRFTRISFTRISFTRISFTRISRGGPPRSSVSDFAANLTNYIEVRLCP